MPSASGAGLAPGTYRHARKAVRFGDIYQGPFFDVYLANDFARMGWQPFAGMDIYSPSLPAEELQGQKARNVVLSHGAACEYAVLLADDCILETAIEREANINQSFLMAPITMADQATLAKWSVTMGLGRCLLPAGSWRVAGKRFEWSGGVAELRRCFPVRRDVLVARKRVASAIGSTRNALAQRWAAHSCRLGPAVVEDIGFQLLKRLAGSTPSDAQIAAAQALTKVATATWSYQGSLELLQDVADDATAVPNQEKSEVLHALTALIDEATAARALVKNL